MASTQREAVLYQSGERRASERESRKRSERLYQQAFQSDVPQPQAVVVLQELRVRQQRQLAAKERESAVDAGDADLQNVEQLPQSEEQCTHDVASLDCAHEHGEIVEVACSTRWVVDWASCLAC